MVTKTLKYLVTLTLWAILVTGQSAFAGSEPSTDHVIKAAFIYNFARFVEWPSHAFANDQSLLTLCVLSRDPFCPALESINGKTINNRVMVVKEVEKINDLGACHLLVVSGSQKRYLSQIFAQLEGFNVLTIGDMEGFAQRGGIINFITVGKKIRFEVNLDAAEGNGLKISSKLLKLAKISRDKEGRN